MHHGKKLRKLRGESAHRMATLRSFLSAGMPFRGLIMEWQESRFRLTTP